MVGKAIIALLLWSSLAYGLETRIKVAIVDSGTPKHLPKEAFCEGAPVDMTGRGPEDVMGHATEVACLAMHGIDTKRVCVVPVKYIHVYLAHVQDMQHTWDYLIKNRVAYVNFSSEGSQTMPGEREQLKTITKRGTVIVAAAGNWDKDLNADCSSFLACYRVKGIRIVGALNAKGGKASYSNWGDVVTDWASDSRVKPCGYFTGTSAAAPKVLNKLLKQAGYGVK